MQNICVFCGSSKGKKEIYLTQAKKLGAALATQGKTLVYGGGNVGLMGAIADEVMTGGGKAIGVIPEFLMSKEVGHSGLTDLIVVDSMHTRKRKMAELADAFIAMPGGFGTLEELAEILTWVQIEIIKKPIALLNIDGYYDLLLKQMDHMVEEGFLKAQNRSLLLNITDADQILHALESFEFSDYSVWSDLDKT
ncbi:TIGR00730 family Rossman fold protein [Fulvivirga ligni]|uniref:LOG family protein n=1 Tax=Fulvivirga ligni TaxID=2904246 RepID=UPI001F39A6FD|nr:TIGR00730 family Rossman fold protein [Fulvivirga ligni]UII22549.1 TIGR00730 family Rossman fold protein [Fulvivirga ligni]